MKWQGKIVEIYDLWWSPHSRQDLPFWCEATCELLLGGLGRRRRLRIAELCSGTGRILIPVVQHLLARSSSIELTAFGVDYSPEMNACLSQKIVGKSGLSSVIEIKELDLTAPNWADALGHEPIDLFLFPFNHFGQMGTSDLQEGISRNISEHLVSEGTLILEDYNPQGSRLRDDGTRKFRWMVADEKVGRALFYWRQSWPFESSHRHAQVQYIVECVERSGNALRSETLSATERICYNSPAELDSTLARYGLKTVARYGGYNREACTEDSNNQIVIVRKRF